MARKETIPLFERALIYGIVGFALFFSGLMVAHASDWTSFVIHVRQGTVSGAVVGGACNTTTVGCARRKPSIQGAWLDGECWITVYDWNGPLTRRDILENWGHELAHCVGKHHNEDATQWTP